MEGPKQNSSTTDVRFNEKAQKGLKNLSEDLIGKQNWSKEHIEKLYCI